MSVDTRPVPCNILAWPRIRDLITQNKFIYCYLYFCPDANACGCYLFSVERAAADLSMTPNSLGDALEEFARRGLISRDKETGEIWITDWPRWHLFNNTKAQGALWSAIGKIQSRKLWITAKNAYESIPEPGKGKSKDKDKASSKEEETHASIKSKHKSPEIHSDAKQQPGPKRSYGGIVCWNIDDTRQAASLEQMHGLESIKTVVEALRKDNVEALPSRVAAHFLKREDGLDAQWWATKKGTDQAALALGLTALPGEYYPDLRLRIHTEIERRRQNHDGAPEQYGRPTYREQFLTSTDTAC